MYLSVKFTFFLKLWKQTVAQLLWVNWNMPPVCKKKIGPAGYQKYSETSLQKAVSDVKARKLSLRNAPKNYGIPPSTLSRKLNNKNPLKMGGQTVFSLEEEKTLVSGLFKCAEWDQPLTTSEIRDTVKSYMGRRGRVEKRFEDNRPGYEWVKILLSCHHSLLSV
ncbi:uncharacterized protein LOC126092385 [Schistocerca cancellata]|uniref:uncharacterized protein LOC126092385 n=1 Tax=Schistocerca cancellata TaxID=274614 RepID=UPI0021196E25|nr:uncharacterized protein LOC126092385 [Schistocerca cancellata]